MTEKNFRKHVIKQIKNLGGHVVAAEGLAVGTPDLLVCYNGRFVGLELKGSTLSNGQKSYYKATPAQLVQLKKIREAGGIAIVLKHSANWREDLKAHLNEEKVTELEDVWEQ